ncbi:hypothetical protein ACFWXK_31610 [Streptomyces sp. NPDC059070]|uniref:hypothetical protein n=1 Tax=Streptomyces sp. NPDC059070 TaxID=3346713 RepID=UPI003677F3B6
MIPLTLLPGRTDATRLSRDRLDLLTALIDTPAFDPLYRDTLIRIPPQHPVYGWRCSIDGCGRSRQMGHVICESHHRLWTQAQASGMARADFLRTAKPLPAARGTDHGPCRICPERPATTAALRLCSQHHARWQHHARTVRAEAEEEALQQWLRTQVPLAGYGICQAVCPLLAASSLGLCRQHESRL